MPTSQAFPPTSRLRRRRDFSVVFEAGLKRHGPLMTVVVHRRPEGLGRLGVAASRKLGNAVERNLAKRRVREIFRRNRPDAVDVVIIPKRPLLTAPFAAVQLEFTGLLTGALRHVRRLPAASATPPRPGSDLSV